MTQAQTNGDARTDEKRQALVRAVYSLTTVEGLNPTAVPGLSLSRRSATTACASAAYVPELVVFLQGQKRVTVGRETHVCDASTFLLTSINMPVVSQITVASVEAPMLALVLALDIPAVREILSQQEFEPLEEPANTRGPLSGVVRGVVRGETTPELLDVCSRLLELLQSPQDIPYLGGLMQRELIYRVLRTSAGSHLRAIATLGEQSQRTAKAVEWLRVNYSKPLRVEELATVARMGVSTLHHQFRSLTAMSPLQYQKQLRLHMARERMLHGGVDAASAAFEVGYESASQFSREYSRFFGQPPMRDVKSNRVTTTEAVAAD